MAKRYCDGCGAPLTDGQTFCSSVCLELIRAKLVNEVPRDRDALRAAPDETKSIVGGPLAPHSSVNSHRAGGLVSNEYLDALCRKLRESTYHDPPHADPEIPRHPLILRKWIAAGGPDSHLTDIVRVQPWLCFAGECIRVDEETAKWFELQPPISGVVVASAGHSNDTQGFIPASVFGDWKRWDLDLVTPANVVSIVVKNLDTIPRRFTAILFGRAGSFEEMVKTPRPLRHPANPFSGPSHRLPCDASPWCERGHSHFGPCGPR